MDLETTRLLYHPLHRPCRNILGFDRLARYLLYEPRNDTEPDIQQYRLITTISYFLTFPFSFFWSAPVQSKHGAGGVHRKSKRMGQLAFGMFDLKVNREIPEASSVLSLHEGFLEFVWATTAVI
jgi:hypothetical protein